MKIFKGKAIYNPSGKAGEYSYWACNYYVGCSNLCSYCYLRKGILKGIMGGSVPTLKKCFKDENDAFNIFQKEMMQNIDSLRDHGLFFTFTSDPMLPETISLTWRSVVQCVLNGIPVKILTKRADFIDSEELGLEYFTMKSMVSFGFTLTGHDEMEPGASPNYERIDAMRKLHDTGFKTFASIEPIIYFESSLEMIRQTVGICDLWKIGLESGKKYSIPEMYNFVKQVNDITAGTGKVYLKDSITNILKLDRFMFPANFVSRDYNLFQ